MLNITDPVAKILWGWRLGEVNWPLGPLGGIFQGPSMKYPHLYFKLSLISQLRVVVTMPWFPHNTPIHQQRISVYRRLADNILGASLNDLSPTISGAMENFGTSCSYIPQTEQHEPEGRMLFCLGNVTYLLDVTPSNPLPHPLSPPPIQLCVIQVQRFGC